MMQIRTDLAVEAKEIWEEATDKTDSLTGVEAWEDNIRGFDVTTVKIINRDGAEALGKPIGTYITLDIQPYLKRERDSFENVCLTLSEQLSKLIPSDSKKTALVVGLGNQNITPDIIGPAAVSNTMITRHLVLNLPEHFSEMRQVAAVSPGVLASTGIESGNIVKAAVEQSGAKLAVLIDALASRKLSRVCSTIQISDTGIVPGSGVGNSRMAIDESFLGVPVITIGVPTVVDAGTLAYDLVSEAGSENFEPEDFSNYGGQMIVTPRDIDKTAQDISKIIGYGLNLALHSGLTIEDITMFLE